MTSYMKFFEDFLQKKESDVQERNTTNNNADDDDDNNEQHSSTTETVPSPKSGTTPSASPTPPKKMEHSYIRDSNATRSANDIISGLAPARTILVRRAPQCPSCHLHPLEEHDLEDGNQAAVPAYNEISAKEAMNECARIAKYVRNTNADDEEWETRINQIGWSNIQKSLFEKVTRVLDDDQLGRLANASRQHESMHRRVLVDKSAVRMRKLLASVAWDTRLTQWLHCLLMDSLPATYMASYLDILQTLKSQVPVLMEKMLFGRPLNINQELLAPVLKKKWEPQFPLKVHKLQQSAVIVALPSMPTNGTIPSRLQKWYQQFASITQIVQITLPVINNHTNQQPLEHIAEQIVSLTRIKIQELRNENPMRSIILIGFNAGSALALQVAMSETVACVVCMGFAYNTIKGIRGTPEDRILDLKVPILFVVGQNSARTSQEEMESLREKMQSETSLVIVGGADDYLRVSKRRRRIENVTQAMVDAMIVDEAYEFIKKILTNPPGPRIPTSVSGSAPHKPNSRSSMGGEKGATPLQRKRKQDAAPDGETSSKARFSTSKKSVNRNQENELMEEMNEESVEFKKPKAPKKSKKPLDPNQPKRKVGRPRTRPLAVASSSSSSSVKTKQISGNKFSTSAGNDELNMAMQSLLGDSGTEQEDSIGESSSSAPQTKLVTNYELVSPTKAALLNKSSLINNSGGSTLGGAKIKMIPSNQFLQIKPQPLQTQSKIYTIKTTTPPAAGTTIITGNGTQTSNSIGSIVRTAPQQQIFTLKSPNGKTTQFVTAPAGTTQQKYTVVKNATGGQVLQLTTAKNVAAVAAASIGENVACEANKSTSRMDLSIIDMPILFADNDGNLTDTSATEDNNNKSQLVVNKPSNSSGVGQLIISQKIIKEANTSSAISGAIGTTKGGAYVISKPASTILSSQQFQGLSSPSILNKSVSATSTTPTSNKVVFINRSTMKPCPNIISRASAPQSFPKYTKVVVSNSKPMTTSLTPRQSVHLTSSASSNSLSSPSSSLVSNVKQLNLQTLKTIAGNNANTTVTRSTVGGNIISLAGKPVHIINKTVGSATSTTATIANNDKPTIIRNIVVKPGNLKQIPAHLTSQLINRNLTVRKLVNFIPGSGSVVSSTTAATTATTSSALTSIETTSPPSCSSSSMQTTPKIITLNPVNSANNSQSKAD